MSDTHSDPGPSVDRPEHRRSPRINTRYRLTGHLVSFGLPVVVRDISIGGFSIEVQEDLPDGVHMVRLQEGDRWSVTVAARSRHRSVLTGDGTVRHVMGFEYEFDLDEQSPDTRHAIRVLFERLAADQPVE